MTQVVHDNIKTIWAGNICVSKKLERCKLERLWEEPHFKIPVGRVVLPILHYLIGIGNQILNFFVDIFVNDIEVKSTKELCLRDQLGDLDENINTLVEVRKIWVKHQIMVMENKKVRETEKQNLEVNLNGILICGIMKICWQNPWRMMNLMMKTRN